MIWTLPNCLTISRILAAPVVCLMVALGGPEIAIWAFALFCVAALTDFLDGWAARRFNQVSALGKMLDPIADKAMVMLVLAALASLQSENAWLFILPMAIIILREVLISGCREFLGSATLSTTMLAKYKTTAQLIAIGVLMLAATLSTADSHGVEEVIYIIGIVLLWIAAILTAITGWDYLQKALVQISLRKG